MGGSYCDAFLKTTEDIKQDWDQNPRWVGVRRDYRAEDVVRLRGSLHVEYSLARRGAEKLCGHALSRTVHQCSGHLTGNQALQMVEARLKAIYLSGWQVAADANVSGQMYPDQSLYPVNSVPTLVRGINNAFRRADQIQTMEGR